MAKQKDITEEIKDGAAVVEHKNFHVTERVKIEGYVADIDGKKFVVTPQITGLTINPLNNNREMGITTKSRCYVYDSFTKELLQEEDGFFTQLSKEQERQLKIAGVIEC